MSREREIAERAKAAKKASKNRGEVPTSPSRYQRKREDRGPSFLENDLISTPPTDPDDAGGDA